MVAPIAALAWLAAAGCVEAEDTVAGASGPVSADAGAGQGDATAADVGSGQGCTSTAACDDGLPCSTDLCGADGKCTHGEATGPACDDGDPCTTGDKCAKGSCAAGTALPCDDGNPCTADGCDPKTGACTATHQSGKCDDGNPCSKADQCEAGKCTGLLFACDDGNPCTDDSCDPKGGACTHAANAKPCSDGNACTEADACKDKACSGKPLLCDDGNPCSNDSCDPKKGCANVPNAATCDDANACTQGDVCADGVCAGKTSPASACDDNNPCTDDGCQAAKGCVHTPVTGPCDDGQACTAGDACKEGQCVSGPSTCQCKSNADCAALDDGDACNGVMVCDAGSATCKLLAGSAVVCPADTSGCATVACEPKTGKCVTTAVADGTGCDADDNLCTAQDTCADGKCLAGKAADCDDGNVCTSDSCKPKVGCLHIPTGAPCDADGDACTVGDVCSGDQCKPGGKKSCTDSNPCTQDSCDAKTGACTHDAKANQGEPCDADFSVCTAGDSCQDGACTKGPPLSCDDNNACTTDSCNPLEGCKHTVNAKPCQDGNGCTVGDSCQDGKCASGATKACIDGDKCTIDSCDPASGQCVYTQIGGCSTKCTKLEDCDDKNPCTDDVCENGTCVGVPNTAPCDDNSVCTTVDKCASGGCLGSGAKACSDGNDCTLDACEPKAGCVHEAGSGPCEGDGNACTVEVCADKACAGSKDKNCSDGNPCTLDGCDAKTGDCTHDGKTLEGDPCDADGSLCTTGDKCAGGTCAKGTALDCDDAKTCTTDSCDPVKGCIHALKGGPCDDGDACTSGDLCDGGICKSGKAQSCDDGDKCTDDGCEAASGKCTHDPVAGCGNFCQQASDCDDGNGCTDDQCSNGKCLHTNHTKACAAGDKCYLSGTCAEGKCAGGQQVDCDDGNKCTDDACVSATGKCVFTSNEAPCDDGDLCTTGDACAQGKCAQGKAKECDDQVLCTDDACDAKTGLCVHTPNKAACDDGDACTTGEACKDGKCAAGTTATLALTVGVGDGGQVDGDAKTAQFKYPQSVDRGPDGALYVTDLLNNQIRKVTLGGQVSTFAGSGQQGFDDGAGDKATFHYPGDAVWAPDGYLYVADTQNHAIRRVSATGAVSTWAGDGKAGAIDGKISKARFNLPMGLAADSSAIYLSEHGNHKVRVLTLDGIVLTLAGTGTAGFKDGAGDQAMFNQPGGLDVGTNGTVWVADMGNHRIRRIADGGFVVTIAGGAGGFADGTGLAASFLYPTDLRFITGGDLVITDRQNHMLRSMTPQAVVSTLAGVGTASTINEPFSVVDDGEGYVWVVSNKNHRILRFKLPVTVCADGNPCTVDGCDAKTGVCSFATAADGESCGPGCIQDQICKSGKCVFGAPKNCNDYDACTNDYCVDAFCKHVPIPGCK